MNARGIWSES